MIDDKKIKSAAQGYCDATYGTLNEHPLIIEAFEQGVNWAIQQFLKDYGILLMKYLKLEECLLWKIIIVMVE